MPSRTSRGASSFEPRECKPMLRLAVTRITIAISISRIPDAEIGSVLGGIAMRAIAKIANM